MIKEIDIMIDDLLGIQVEKRQEDYFKTNNLISLGARHTQSYYENNEIPEEEEVNINIPDSSTSNNLHIAYIEGSRRGKTRLSKNIILQLQQFGYHILVIEPKINEWIKARYNGQGSWFHPTQKNTKIKLINYVPSYLESKIPQDQKHLYKLFSPNILSFENPEDWASIGVSEVASEVISAFVIKSLREKTSISLDIIESMIKKSRRLQSGTSNSALTAINNLRNVGFFSYSDINFKQNWEDGFAIIVSFPGGEGSRMNVIIDKLVKKIESIGVYEKLNNLEITRKMIAFEDCSYYATSSDSTSTTIKYVHNNLSAYGVNSILTIQLPDLISPTLIDGCNIKIVGFVNNMQTLSQHLPDNARFSLKQRPLYSNRDSYTFERILIEDNKIVRFYAFSCMCGH